MTESKHSLATLFAACWKDEALKARFIADPKAVLNCVIELIIELKLNCEPLPYSDGGSTNDD